MIDLANRIVATGTERPDQILANPWNYRLHQQYQREALTGVLRDVGMLQSVTINQRTGRLVDGHLRVEIALDEDEPSVDVKYVDLDEREELAVLALKDPLARLAETDQEQLTALIGAAKPETDAMRLAMAEISDRFLTGDATLPPQPTEAAYVPHPHEDKAQARASQEQTGAIQSPMKVVYLYMSQDVYDRTIATLRRLAKRYETETLVATVLRTVEEQAST